MTVPLKRRLSWRLRVMMAERKINTATELQRLLEKSGFQITSSQLTRIIRDRPDRISSDLLDHLLEVLRCDIGDLLRNDPVTEEEDLPEKRNASESASPTLQKKPRKRREISEIRPDENLTGPKITAFTIPPRKLS
ncbi:MAG: helix-turn-helix transcriptional regulator [Ferrovum myxofaciens]